LQERSLDFIRALELFDRVTVTMDDARHDYREIRPIAVGMLDSRIVARVWTQRGITRRIISMRYANEREKNKYSPALGCP
jgi:hypothetical protein